MSGLEIEIRKLIADYLAGKCGLAKFRGEQVALMGRALAAGDEAALDIADEVELMLAERSTGERTEDQLLEALRPFAITPKALCALQEPRSLA